MKKLFLIAVAGMMMFAFTQCGGDSAKKNMENAVEQAANGFEATKMVFNEALTAINNAKDCDDLEQIGKDMEEVAKKAEKKFPDYQPTDAEQMEIASLALKVADAAEKKAKELKCEE